MATHRDPRKGPEDRIPPTGRLTVTTRLTRAFALRSAVRSFEPVAAVPLDPGASADQDHLRRVLTGVARHQAVRIATDEPLSAGRAALRITRGRDDRVRGAIRVSGNCPICIPKNGTRVPADADVRSRANCDLHHPAHRRLRRPR